MKNPPLPDTLPVVLPPGEEQLRLFGSLDRTLGLTKLDGPSQQTIFELVVAGLQQSTSLNAPEWAALLMPFTIHPCVPAGQQTGVGGVDPHPLLRTLLVQPSVTLDPKSRRACCFIAARFFLGVGVQLVNPPTAALLGLRNLFRSQDPAWAALRSIDAEAAKQCNPDGKTRSFTSYLAKLLATPLPPPTIPAVEAFAPEPRPTDPPEAEVQQIKVKKPEVDVVSPNRHMFRDQISRSLGSDLLNPNRLPLWWARCAVPEAKAVLEIVRRDLEAERAGAGSWRRAIYATMRLLSLQACASMRACFRMPLDGDGDLCLDLAAAGLVRDWSVAAPRKRAPPGETRCAAFSATTPVLPAAIHVLKRLRERWPAATTLGEMIQSEGITLRAAGQALNADWSTSHRPEDARFAWSWRPILLALGGHPAVVARMTGDILTVPIVDQYYISIQQRQIDALMRAFSEWAGFQTKADGG